MAWDDSAICGEHADWYRDHDPVLIYARKRRSSRGDAPGRLGGDRRASDAQIAEAREFALDSPPQPESALEHVFA